MNIFVLSRNVRTCAQQHCDQHVVKMPLETAQLLSTGLYCANAVHWQELHASGLAYRPTHLNHPCAVWARACINNYLWLARLGLELCAEYTFRYGKTHKSQPVIAALRAAAPDLPRGPAITPFAIVVPDDCLVPGDPVSSYRACYMRHKARFARWTRRPMPEWLAAGSP